MDTLISTEGITEAISRFVDPREPFTDSPGFGWMSRKMGYYTRLDDRSDGRYSPMYDCELDLKSIRMAAWLMDAEVPVAKAMKNRLVDYTIANGFDWQVQHENKKIETVLNAALDDVLENMDWESMEIESFEREIVDGEFLAEIVVSSGDISMEILEGDNLTEPLNSGDLEDWQGIHFPTSWSFGVLTKEGSATPRGYHIVRNTAATDWDFIKPENFVHWKRNVPRNAKRGGSDHFTTHRWLNYGNKVLSNTAQGAALQAAIAYIVEHGPGVNKGQAQALANARSNVVVKNDPITGQAYRNREVRPGQVIDVKNGQKYHSSLLGSNASNIYIEVMEALFRLSGTVYAFPENMLTGYAGNNNRASSETAESPFIQGRYRDQRLRSRRTKKLIKQLCKLIVRHTKAITQDWDEVEAGLTITVNRPELVTRDISALTQALQLQKAAGWVSDRQAMTELGRDYEEIQEQKEAEAEEAAERAKRLGVDPSQPGPGDPPSDGSPPAAGRGAKPKPSGPSGPGNTDTPDGTPGGDNESKPAGEVKEGLAGFGKVASATRDGIKRLFESGCSRYSESFGGLQENGNHDQKTHGRPGKGGGSGGGGGSAVKSGVVDVSKWKQSNSAAQWGTKKIAMMQEVAAKGDIGALKKMWEPSEAYKSGAKKMNQYQKGVWETKQHLEAKLSAGVTAKPVQPKGEWKKVGTQLGSNPGGKFTGPDGSEYYVKFPNNSGHASSEVLASKLYELAGAGVKPQTGVEIDGKVGVAGKWLDVQKSDWNAIDKAKAADDFAVHAWLGNWDAVGMGGENIQKHGDKLIAIDVGGSLEFRAQGGHKSFGDSADEWFSMRDPKINGDSAAVFGNMTQIELHASAQKLKHISPSDISKIVDAHYMPGGANKLSSSDMKKVLLARRDKILDRADEIAKGLNATPSESKFGPGVMGKKIPYVPPTQPKGVVPPSMPAKPIIASKANAGHQKHLDAIHALAVKGDIAGVQAYTKGQGKNTYGKQTTKYKAAVLSALGAGADPKTAASHVTKSAAQPKPAPVKKPFKTNMSELPSKPEFKTSNQKIKAINDDLAAKAEAFAKAGDLPSLDEIFKKSESPKLTTYVTGLMHGIDAQFKEYNAGPPKPKVPLDAKYVSAASKISTKQAKDKIGYWTVHGTVKAPVERETDSWLSSGKANALFNSGGEEIKSKASQSQMKTIKAYTGGSYDSINDVFRAPSDYKTASTDGQHAKALRSVFNKSATVVPEGATFGRRHGGNVDISKLSAGDVVSDPGFLSTSTNPTFWHGSVHWRMEAGKGVKALPVDNVSSHQGEKEVIFPPGQRMVVTKVTSVPPATAFNAGDKWVVHAVLLPSAKKI